LSEYATESPVSLRKRRQRRRALITLGVVLLGLFFAFWYALSYFESDSQSQAGASAGPTCQPADPNVLTPQQVTVRVLNATNRTGLAASTAKGLASRGFDVSGAANDSSKRKTPAVAEVRYGPQGEAGAKLVLTVMPKGTKLYNDKRKGAKLDVVLGTKFTSLLPVVAASPTGLPTCPAPSGS
jgi:hypothetical protein